MLLLYNEQGLKVLTPNHWMQICSLYDLSLIRGSMEVEVMGIEADGTEKLCGKILPNAELL